MAAASATSGEPLTPSAFGPLRLLVVQPTPFCNLDCDYCYLPSRDDRSRLPLDLLERTLERVLESPYASDDFTLLWHAGEPLTMPIAFYDEATALIRSVLARREGGRCRSPSRCRPTP